MTQYTTVKGDVGMGINMNARRISQIKPCRQRHVDRRVDVEAPHLSQPRTFKPDQGFPDFLEAIEAIHFFRHSDAIYRGPQGVILCVALNHPALFSLTTFWTQGCSEQAFNQVVT